MITLILLLTCRHTALGVIYLLLFCLLLLFLIKSTIVRLLHIIIAIIFVTGVLLLLFYLSIMNVNIPSWSDLQLILLILIIPNIFDLNNYKYTVITCSVELYRLNLEIIIYLILAFILVLLFIIRYFIIQLKWLRQVF